MGQGFCNAVVWIAELVRVKKSWKLVEISLTTFLQLVPITVYATPTGYRRQTTGENKTSLSPAAASPSPPLPELIGAAVDSITGAYTDPGSYTVFTWTSTHYANCVVTICIGLIFCS